MLTTSVPLAHHTGFEPVIFAVKVRCPGPLDEWCMVKGKGIERFKFDLAGLLPLSRKWGGLTSPEQSGRTFSFSQTATHAAATGADAGVVRRKGECVSHVVTIMGVRSPVKFYLSFGEIFVSLPSRSIRKPHVFQIFLKTIHGFVIRKVETKITRMIIMDEILDDFGIDGIGLHPLSYFRAQRYGPGPMATTIRHGIPTRSEIVSFNKKRVFVTNHGRIRPTTPNDCKLTPDNVPLSCSCPARS